MESGKLRSLQFKHKVGFFRADFLAIQKPQATATPHPASLPTLLLTGQREAVGVPGPQLSPSLRVRGKSSRAAVSRVNPLVAGLVLVVQAVKWLLTFFPLLPPCVPILQLNTWLKRG